VGEKKIRKEYCSVKENLNVAGRARVPREIRAVERKKGRRQRHDIMIDVGILTRHAWLSLRQQIRKARKRAPSKRGEDRCMNS